MVEKLCRKEVKKEKGNGRWKGGLNRSTSRPRARRVSGVNRVSLTISASGTEKFKNTQSRGVDESLLALQYLHDCSFQALLMSCASKLTS